MTNIPIQENILKKIGQLADRCNLKIYIVGGYVRDYFLGRERKDFDITVIGDSLDFAKKVGEEFNSKIVIYERFRTALVPIGDYHVEFVGTRKEEYEANSRNPIVTEGTFEDDINRRDFTVNAMSCSLNADNFGELVDLHNGIIDLNNKVLRTPLDPITTYSDDPLRMMRAARFASQLQFDVEEKSLEAISKMADRIKIISQERITDEFLKIIASPKPSIGLTILFNTGLLKYIFPELHELEGSDVVEDNGRKFFHKNVFWHSLKVLDNIVPNTDDVWLRFAALMHDIGKARTKKYIKGIGWTFHGHEEIGARMQKIIFRNMKFPMDYLPYVEKLVRLHQRPMHLIDEEITDSAIRRLAAQAGPEIHDLFTLCRADITTKNQEKEKKYKNNYEVVFQKIIDVQEKDQLRAFQSPVRGEEIMEICKIQPSRLVGQIKNEIEEAILEGIIPNEYEAAKDFFLDNKDAWIEKYAK
jgi:putative nucleotidyltransferase with HDIG domain